MARVIDVQTVALDLRILPFKCGSRYCFEVHDRRTDCQQTFITGEDYKSLQRQVLRVIKRKKAQDLVFFRKLTATDISRGRCPLESYELDHLQNALRPLFI